MRKLNRYEHAGNRRSLSWEIDSAHDVIGVCRIEEHQLDEDHAYSANLYRQQSDISITRKS